MNAICTFHLLLSIIFTTLYASNAPRQHPGRETLRHSNALAFFPQDSLDFINQHKQDSSTTSPSALKPSSQDTLLPVFNYENVKNYIFSNLHYPSKALEEEIEGTVFVHFRICKDGKIDNIKIKKSTHPSLDSAALHLIQKMPQWQPLVRQGKAESHTYTVPISFTIPKQNKEPNF